MSSFLNPYNFVRPLPDPRERLKQHPLTPDSADLHLLGRCPPPPYDRYTGLSGRITCTMTAQTPVFISGEPSRTSNEKHLAYDLFQVNGEYIIPGASLRGPIRSLFEAVTNSTFGASGFTDEPLFYRMPAENALGLVPARVEPVGEGWRLRFLTGAFPLQPSRSSKNLYAAWIPRYPNDQILRKQDPRKHKHYLRPNQLVTIPQDCQDGKRCYAAVFNTKSLSMNNQQGFPHWQADFIHRDQQVVNDWIRQQRGRDYQCVEGYVYATNLNADVKQYERFFYADGSQPVQTTPLDEQVARAYNDLMQDYHNRHEAIDKSLNSQSDGGRNGIQPSRFVRRREQLEEGTLVYADVGERDSKGNYEVRAIYPVNISRARYQQTIRDVIQKRHEYLLAPTEIDQLCPASRVFGWVSQEKQPADRLKPNAYRGRVRFSHAQLLTPETLRREPRTLAILGKPNPTSVEFYLQPGVAITPGRGSRHGYDDPRAVIRGRKFYRHHGIWNWQTATAKPDGEQNRTIKAYYDIGSQWSFTIDFENLQLVELGALLWTLKLPFEGQSCFHRIGYGKPLGLGSTQIEVTGLHVMDAGSRYAGGDEQGGWRELDTTVQAHLVGRFQNAMTRLYGKAFADLEPIRDLQMLLTARTDQLPIHYPRPQLRNPGDEGNEGFQWFMENRRDKPPISLKPAAEDDGLPYKGGKRR